MSTTREGTQGWTSGNPTRSILGLTAGRGWGCQDVRLVGEVEGFGKHPHLVAISHTPVATREALPGAWPSNPSF